MNYNRREFLFKLAGTAILAGCAGTFTIPVSAQDRSANSKPNIVMILADDLGWSDLSCYGNKFYETPNLDKLARQGMRFTDAYAAAPLCSPTRACLLTGKYPARLGLTSLTGRQAIATAKWKEPTIAQHVPLDEITIFEALKTAGYATASIGKWHIGEDPLKQGADISMAEGGQPPDYFYPYQRTLNNGQVMELGRAPSGREGDYLKDKRLVFLLCRLNECPSIYFASFGRKE